MAVRHEVSAGGVIYKVTNRGVFVAFIRDSVGKMTFPKGHVEKGEAFAQAAARETMEELGLSELRLVAPLGKIDIWFRDRFRKKGALVHKDIHYFLFEAPVHATLRPNPKERAFEAQWVSTTALMSTSSYADMVPILKRALTRF